jgi:hypothetical protein
MEIMEIKEWITLLAAFIVAMGWFVTGHLNRVKDVAQKRLQYRLETLEAFLPIGMSLQKKEDPFNSPEFCKQFEDAQVKFQLYGFEDEAKLMSSFTKSLLSKNQNEAEGYYRELASLVRARIRNELKING